MALSLVDEFEGIVAALEAAGVDYALVGALAVAVHGCPRATADIELLVRPESLDHARAVARGSGFTLEALPLRFRDGVELRRLTKVVAGEHVTLDLILVNETLEPVWASRGPVETEAGPLRVVSRDALIAMKLASGRPQDVADVERLRELDR